MKLICNYYIRNYGSVLQSYATFRVLNELGHETRVICYRDRPSRKAKAEIALRIRLKYLADRSMVKQKVRKLLHGDGAFARILQSRGEAFDAFNREALRFTEPCDSPSDAAACLEPGETVVIGSDQLWGPEDIIRDYHTLNWVPAGHRKVAYATSFGVKQLPKFVQERAKRFLSDMDRISVREASGVEIVGALTGKEVPQVCDPTLLLSGEAWADLAAPRLVEEPYIFLFFIGDNPGQRKAVRDFARRRHLKIVAIQHLDRYIASDEGIADLTFNAASPREFLTLIRDASYVFCDSFHAAIFSVQFEKRFLIFNRYGDNTYGSRNSRIDSLCSRLGLEDRRAGEGDDLDRKIDQPVDYRRVKEALNQWRTASLDYLQKALEE